MTLLVTVGGTSMRPRLRDGHLENREILPLTLSFDHGVVDGAPAARFVATLRDLTETAAAFENNLGEGL